MTASDRPLLHYTPPSGWLNDPNGLVHVDGEYHLFYQHNPSSIGWGSMHWGHAVSTDLVRWTDLPIALHPDAHGAVYSGSAVIDHADAAGFGRGTLIALFTHHTDSSQVQSLAYSTDRGLTWTPYPGNPVLDQPRGIADFRDPKVFWYGDRHDGHWVMILVAGDHARIYASGDLTTWELTSTFGPDDGPDHRPWETPDLFDLPNGTTAGDRIRSDAPNARRWVLSVGAGAGAPAGGSGTRYWVGDFDGASFTPRQPARWADRGADFYAAQSWSGTEGERRIWTAWMSNWAYAGAVPAGTWRGQMTVPRELRLVDDGQGWVLAQRPVSQIRPWLQSPLAPRDGVIVSAHCAMWIRMEIAVWQGPSPVPQMVLRGATGTCVVEYDATDQVLTLDRTGARLNALPAAFAAVHRAHVQPLDGRVDLDVLVDVGSVEVFANDGRVVLTDLVPGLDAPLRIGLPAGPAIRSEVRPLRPPTP